MIRPLGARVVVKRLDAPKPASQLIEVPDTVEGQISQYGLVIAIGKLVHGGFDIGDTVILSNYAGAPCRVNIDGDEIEAAMVTEDDVLCVVEGL